MASDPERHVMEKAYAHWTPIGDMLCAAQCSSTTDARPARRATSVGAELIERSRLPPFGLYTLVRFRRCEMQSVVA